MSERRESNGIDALIDEAARRLVAGEPSSSLRSSVRDRIGKRRPTWFGVPAWGMAAAIAVAVLIVGRALSGPPGGSVGRTLSGPADGAVSERPTIERAAPAVASLPDEPAAIQPVPSTSRQLGRRLAADVAAPPEEESLIPPITIEPLTAVPLRAVELAVDVSSGVMPIEIEPLQIEPLLGQ